MTFQDILLFVLAGAVVALVVYVVTHKAAVKADIAKVNEDVTWLYDKVFTPAAKVAPPAPPAAGTPVDAPAGTVLHAPDGTIGIVQPNGTATWSGAAVVPAISPADAVKQILVASVGQVGYRCLLSWNSLAWLAQRGAKGFAEWCAQVAALPECAADPSSGASASLGWITNLSTQGAGVLSALNQRLVAEGFPGIPATDPRLAP